MTAPTAVDKSKVMDFSGLAIRASQFQDESGNAIDLTPASAITSLTDSSGGATANNTLAAVVTQAALTDNSGGSAADGTIDAVTDAATSADAVKELATKINLLVTATNTHRDNITDVAAKVNAILTALRNVGIVAT